MIKLENVVTASPEQLEFIIEGMRNPMNSWEKSDSSSGYDCNDCGHIKSGEICYKVNPVRAHCQNHYTFNLGENDLRLMQCLSDAGTEHRKYMRMMPVYVRITAPLYWWKEFDTYKIGTVANSCSTMHKIAEKKFTRNDFSWEHLSGDGCIPDHDYQSSTYVLDLLIESLNFWRNEYLTGSEGGTPKDKRAWWQMIQLLPSSYNQTRNVMLNYEVLANIYRQRKNHKLDEWREFCAWIEILPYHTLITGYDAKKEKAWDNFKEELSDIWKKGDEDEQH